MNTSTPYFDEYIKKEKYVKLFEIGTRWIADGLPFDKNMSFTIERYNPFLTLIRYRYENNMISIRDLQQFINEYERGNLHLL